MMCFNETFDKAFKNNGGIGGWFDGGFPQDPANYDIGRFLFDNINNLLIQVIMV